jgi:hypothetical protein
MKILVHTFALGYTDDPGIHAAQPIWEWQQTEQGQWVMEHCCPEPVWTVSLDHRTYQYRVNIVADLSDQDSTYYCLKWK